VVAALQVHGNGLRAGRPGFHCLQFQEIFSSLYVYRKVFSGIKRQEREADHSSPSNGEVKNGGAIPPFCHAP
jgi:hypothetical protein